MTDEARKIRRLAAEAYGSDDVWIDADAEVIQAGMEGYWVRADVWVPMTWMTTDTPVDIDTAVSVD
jgi:hypothetical protein